MADTNGPRPGDAVDQESALETLLAGVAERLPPERAPLVAALARAAYRRLPLAQLRALDPGTVAASFRDAYQFVDARQPGAVALRVHDPDPADDGWGCDGTVVEVSADDSPFLLSTVSEELDRLGIEEAESVHAVFGAERDGAGRLAAILPARGAARREAWQRRELVGRLHPGRRDEVAANLERVLGDALAATRDFPAMTGRLEDVVERTRRQAPARYDRGAVEEACALLRWLLDDHFILLGYREYDVRGGTVAVRRDSGLGILADESASTYAEPVPLAAIEPALRDRILGGELLTVARTNRTSTVHRQTQMVYVGVKEVGEDGGVTGELRLLGLFAQRAHAEPASTIPVLRRKLRGILEAEDIVDHSHDERSLRALFEAFPKHELFAADVDALRRTLVALLEAQQRRDVRLLTRRDPTRSAVSALVAMPRERFNSAVRHRIQMLLAEWARAVRVDYQLSLTERDQALLHFVLHRRPDDVEDPGTAARDPGVVPDLERRIAEAVRSWDDELAEALVDAHGPGEGRRLAAAWSGRFPPGYADTNSAPEAVFDVAELEALADDDARLRLRPPDRRGLLRFKLYKTDSGAELSSFLPILESLGFIVVEEVPHRIEGDRPLVLHDFGVRVEADVAVDVDRDGSRVSAAATAIWAGRAEADSLNHLVLEAGLTWEEVALLRAYRRYRRQVGTAFTEEYQNRALVAYPDVARALVDLFDARFAPHAADRDPDAARQAVLHALEPVERLDQDRILRGYLGLVDATLRTNRYLLDGGSGRRALALKLDSVRVPDVPRPVPHVEVFVYAPAFEGIHLRGGPVARGGVRFSDRQEDVRTEVLGLMKAQMTKNALIVPTGAKGGFVLKTPGGAGRRRTPDRAREPHGENAVRGAYEAYVRALLDITDNVVTTGGDAAVVPPDGVRRADGEDPYLVVAPDRGTARLSDLANAISEEYGFWLGDAFASGGSRGYDHKAMGITARGAWAAVRRHFRELGVDVQTEPVTVAGVGDMSGDVFGNAMLQSRSCRLVAAFDHRHVFLDPDPDPEAAYAERRRLAAAPRSSWADYDRSLLSPGGGVWPRTVKSVPLSPQVRTLLRVDDDALSPPELVRAILRAPVDLLFAGGIGTFVKASTERHGEVGDRTNDAIRIDAGELGARVVGEGANLALTQRARIQYARRGGRCNTDSIDNAAGVATSDREVNLKILLRHVPDLDGDERDEVLAAAEDDVARMVLSDVEAQTAVLSRELAASPTTVDAYEALMSELEQGQGAARLEREVEALPDTQEMARRRDAGAGMTRPELAVLLGYAKADLAEQLIASPVPDEPLLASTLRGYFPPPVVRRFDDALDRHRLRRELVATLVANNLVNRMGITYASRTAGEFGASLPAVAAAYWVAREVASAEEQWKAVEPAGADPVLQRAVTEEYGRLVDAYTRIYLHRRDAGDLAAAVARDRPASEELEKSIWELGTPRRRAARTARAERLVDDGVDPTLAERVVGAGELTFAPDVAAVARSSGQPVQAIADVFLRLSEALPLERLHELLQGIEPEGPWQRWQQRGLADDLRELRRGAAARAVGDHPGLVGEETVARYLHDRSGDRGRVDALVRRLEARPEDAGLAGIAVAVRALRELLES